MMYKFLEILEIFFGDITGVTDIGLAVFPMDSAIDRCRIPSNLINVGYGSCYSF